MKKKIEKIFFDSENRFFGIVAPLTHYRFSWMANQQLGFSFEQINPIQFNHPKTDQVLSFDNYYAEFDESIGMRLISNKNDLGFLIEKHKNFDFILIFQGELKNQNVSEILNSIKTVEGVQAVFELEEAVFKNYLKFLL